MKNHTSNVGPKSVRNSTSPGSNQKVPPSVRTVKPGKITTHPAASAGVGPGMAPNHAVHRPLVGPAKK